MEQFFFKPWSDIRMWKENARNTVWWPWHFPNVLLLVVLAVVPVVICSLLLSLVSRKVARSIARAWRRRIPRPRRRRPTDLMRIQTSQAPISKNLGPDMSICFNMFQPFVLCLFKKRKLIWMKWLMFNTLFGFIWTSKSQNTTVRVRLPQPFLYAFAQESHPSRKGSKMVDNYRPLDQVWLVAVCFFWCLCR